MKYIVVTGGVVSGLGKGVTISSMGRLLQASGLTVTAIKIDPYLNVDAGTMSPYEHGEVFVLEDGGESDLDLGNYERFLGIQLTQDHNITTGKMYRHVIVEERKGAFLGKTVQVVPHVTDAIQNWLERVSQVSVNQNSSTTPADVCLIEVGGTVGDIESAVFLEALRQFQFRVGHENFVLCFVSLVPTLSGEQKTKPTQHGVKDLRSLGLSPSIIFCRSADPLHAATRDKISNFCHVPADHVLSVNDVTNVYHVPALLEAQGLHTILSKALLSGTNTAQQQQQLLVPDLGDWKRMANAVDGYTHTVTIALIGKYTGLQDSYLSVVKALRHAAIAVQHKLEILWMEASDLEDDDDGNEASDAATKRAAAWDQLKAADGVVVPGGFGIRGWEGKLRAAEYCRTHQKPLLGICLGFQAMVVEYARNVMGLAQADSTECNPDTPHPVVFFMPEIDPTTMGGTMRLGSRTTTFIESSSSSKTQALYGGPAQIQERHRHRYEVNPVYAEQIHDAGLSLIGRDEDRMEIAELLDDSNSNNSPHPYYVGTQFHPEFKSRPLHPSPPFRGLLLAATGQLDAFLSSTPSG